MTKKTDICGIQVQIRENEVVRIFPVLPDGVTVFSKPMAQKLIAFLQQWIDHDPEQELIEKISELRYACPSVPEGNAKIIAAVREHDARENSK